MSRRKKLSYQYTKTVTSYNGYPSQRRVYECEGCSVCPLIEKCTRSKYNRRLFIGEELRAMMNAVCELLTSPKVVKLRSQRPIKLEAVYGRLKNSWGFRRFLMRGKEKVNVEWGLLCMAHNMAKVAVR